MSVLHIADAQNAFASHLYAKKLVRALQKAGMKARIWDKDTTQAADYLKQHPPKRLHLHYHPAARKLREVMRVAEELNIPTVVTYHEVVRVPPEREAHIRKCLERTRSAFFITPEDRAAAIAINPRLKDHAHAMAVPAPKKQWAEDLKAARPKQWLSFHQKKTIKAQILYCGEITRESGVEQMLGTSSQFPEGVRLVIAGTVPAGQGAFAKKLKAQVAYGKLPVTLHISKRTFGLKAIEALLEECLFAYLPNGNPFAENYGGATTHPLLLPCYNVTQTLVFSHAGRFTTPAVREQLVLVENPRALADTIAALHATPKKILTQLQSADRAASVVSWQSVAKQAARVYKSQK